MLLRLPVFAQTMLVYNDALLWELPSSHTDADAAHVIAQPNVKRVSVAAESPLRTIPSSSHVLNVSPASVQPRRESKRSVANAW